MLSEDIKPNYDKGNMKFFDSRTISPLRLECKHQSNSKLTWLVIFYVLISNIYFSFNENFPNLKYKWIIYYHVCREKNGTEINSVPNLKGRVKINDKENNLIISETQPEDAGKYTCRLPDNSYADFEVIGKYDCYGLISFIMLHNMTFDGTFFFKSV